MRTTKQQLAEQVIRILNGGTPSSDNELDIREVSLYVSQAFASTLRIRYFQNKAEGDDAINGSYIYTFKDIPITEDNDLDLHYSVLPASTIDLPGDLGIYYVGYMQDQNNPFIRVPNGFMGISNGLKSSRLNDRVGYFVEGNSIFYVNYKSSSQPCKVLLKLLVAYGDIDECDEISMPLDIQDEVISKAIQLFRLEKEIPKDISNDNIK